MNGLMKTIQIGQYRVDTVECGSLPLNRIKHDINCKWINTVAGLSFQTFFNPFTRIFIKRIISKTMYSKDYFKLLPHGNKTII